MNLKFQHDNSSFFPHSPPGKSNEIFIDINTKWFTQVKVTFYK